jgi:2-keto-4-pentenoate hydratase/2-oxohepta-3-ene-1,7-dioic acid hydratase in catechol pathway
MERLRFLRVGKQGSEQAAVMDKAGNIRSLQPHIHDFHHTHLMQLEQLLDDIDIEALPIVPPSVRIAPPVAQVGNVIAVGLNYDEHINETGSKATDEPLLFNKSPHAICGAYDPVIIPKGATKVDWEVELVVVIGKEARYISEADALSVVAGYCTGIDVSERDFQKNRSGQWLKGKSADTFAPIGPYLVPASQVDLEKGLSVWTDINGKRKQSSNTLKMIHSVPTLISYTNQFMSLHPGDLIFTGTPEGVGLGFNPPEFLQAGDMMEVSVEGLGQQKHPLVSFDAMGDHA